MRRCQFAVINPCSRTNSVNKLTSAAHAGASGKPRRPDALRQSVQGTAAPVCRRRFRDPPRTTAANRCPVPPPACPAASGCCWRSTGANVTLRLSSPAVNCHCPGLSAGEWPDSCAAASHSALRHAVLCQIVGRGANSLVHFTQCPGAEGRIRQPSANAQGNIETGHATTSSAPCRPASVPPAAAGGCINGGSSGDSTVRAEREAARCPQRAGDPAARWRQAVCSSASNSPGRRAGFW